MSQSIGYKTIFFLYQAFRNFRYLVLQSVFGVTIHCKHSPTCGTYMFQKIKSDGVIIGTLKGLRKVVTCW